MFIFSLTQKEYVQAVLARFGKGEYYASRIYADLFKRGDFEPKRSWVEPQAEHLVEKIVDATKVFSAEISSCRQEGQVQKFVTRFADQLEVESVIIPMKFGVTLCISSQVGCKMGCSFCQTAKMGLLRSLSVEEIVFQVFAAKFILGSSVRNIVFMGMGEPFDNYEHLMQAIRVLSDDKGFAIPLSRITVSTSGRVPEILRFAQEADPRLNLAVSLNAPTDVIRAKIMPVNRDWGLAALQDAMQVYCSTGSRKIFIEYVLLAQINDSLEDAQALVAYLGQLPVTINLIPYNAQEKGRFQAPSEEVSREFQNYLRDRGYKVFLRISRGRSIMAACGQLGNRELRLKLYEIPRNSQGCTV